LLYNLNKNILYG